MYQIGVPQLSLEVRTDVDGECSLCSFDLLVGDETYIFSNEENLIAAYHKDCFRHIAVVIHEHFKEFGLPKKNDNRN